MSKLKKILIAAVVIVCGVAAVVMAYLRFADFGIFSQYTGKWTTVGEENQLFAGEVEAVELKTKPGSKAKTMLLFYNKEHQGFICTQISEKAEMICTEVILTKDKIEKDDRVDMVTKWAIEDMPLLKGLLERTGNTLKIKVASLADEKCAQGLACNYMTMVTLKR